MFFETNIILLSETNTVVGNCGLSKYLLNSGMDLVTLMYYHF